MVVYICFVCSYANGELSKLGYDVVTVDGSVSRDAARDSVEGRAGLQGNYDPRELVDDGHHTPETVRQTAHQLLMELGPQRLIANLGEGLGGNESPALVKAFVDAIHQESKEMIVSSPKK
jgi:uroporphyrinogen decarboxylase